VNPARRLWSIWVQACRSEVASSRSVAAGPQQPDALGDAAQQLDGVPLDARPPTPTRPRRRPGRGRSSEPGGTRGDAGLGRGQPAVGEQGKAAAVGDQRDERIEAGEQPAAVLGWHGGSLRGRLAWRPQPATPLDRPEEGCGDLWTTAAGSRPGDRRHPLAVAREAPVDDRGSSPKSAREYRWGRPRPRW
jgi:hypothetical protein